MKRIRSSGKKACATDAISSLRLIAFRLSFSLSLNFLFLSLTAAARLSCGDSNLAYVPKLYFIEDVLIKWL